MIARRLTLILAAVIAALPAAAARAQLAPDRPVQLVVPISRASRSAGPPAP